MSKSLAVHRTLRIARRAATRLGASLGLAIFAWLLASALGAQTYQVLHSFGAVPAGQFPQAGLASDASGNLYGTTSAGGLYGNGTVFKIDAANGLTTIHAFSGPDGSSPRAAVIVDASGNLYGTTVWGGLYDRGTAFKLDAANNYALTTLHSFAGGPDGAYPTAAVIADASGNLYGTTYGGGPSDLGTVFKLDASNSYALTTFHGFAGGPDGAHPYAAVIADASGNFYGTTSGQYGSDYGTVFKLDAANNYALTTLHVFAGGPDGAYPYAAVIADASGNLYGTTYDGGYGRGTVYELDAANNYALTTLHKFGGPDGSHPYAELIAGASGNLYGTTYGDYETFYGGYNGTVFRLEAANGYALTTLHTFGVSDGAYPRAAVIADASGNLYGTTSDGGSYFSGALFRLDAANGYSLTTLHTFGVMPDGIDLQAAVIADYSGNLYGTTAAGGSAGYGTVFKLDAANNYSVTTLHSFSGPDGSHPYAALIADASGNLYGTTAGAYGIAGTVFKLDAANNYALTTLHTFSGPAEYGPWSAVIADAQGNLYGTAPVGYGIVYKLDVANGYALTTLHSFDGSDGIGLLAGLMADASGNLYGTTTGSHGFGGPSEHGTVFKLEAANNYALTTLHSFSGPDGEYPGAGLIADASGNLYGTTSDWAVCCDSPHHGTVFKLDAANNYALTTLHSFDGLHGAYPFAAVLADASGNLYGTTWGGQAGDGSQTIFKLDAANDYALTTLHTFHYTDGSSPRAELIADASGNLFGTAADGGAFGGGVVFSINMGVPAPVTGITPTSGPSAGGTVVSITGADFSTASSVTIGGTIATEVTVVSATEITAVTTQLSPGKLNDVAVTNPTSGPSIPGVLYGAFFSDFLDVPQADIFHADVEKVFRNGITAGCGGGDYCRNSPVTRAQMAVFLLKGEHGSAYLPPACAGIFGDVPCPSQYATWIEQLSAEGITAGCGGGNYCPGNSVTRAQIAVFLLKTEHGSSYLPPPCAGTFGDVACPSQYADWIEQLSAEGITGGCGAGNYCPGNPASRGQMAVFLVKTFGLQ